MNKYQSQINKPDVIPTFSSVPTSPKGRLTLVIKIVVGVVVILVVGLGVALATRLWDPMWSPFRPEPEEVIERMYQNIREAKSLRAELTLKIEQGLAATIIKLSNESDKSDPDSTKSKGRIEVASEHMFSFTLDYIIVDKKLYFKLDKIPSFMSMVPSPIEGVWIDAGELYNQFTEQPKGFGEIVKEAEEALVFKEELEDEKIDSKRVYHYLLSIDEEKLRELSQAATSSAVPFTARGGQTDGPIDQQLEEIKDFEINYFIGKKDELLYKMSAYKEVEEESSSVSFELTFSDFNKELSIEVPKGAKKMEEILGNPFGGTEIK